MQFKKEIPNTKIVPDPDFLWYRKAPEIEAALYNKKLAELLMAKAEFKLASRVNKSEQFEKLTIQIETLSRNLELKEGDIAKMRVLIAKLENQEIDMRKAISQLLDTFKANGFEVDINLDGTEMAHIVITDPKNRMKYATTDITKIPKDDLN